MRSWFVLFLSLLVMAGSLIPCCPADNCQDESSITMTCDPDEERETGTCSPFLPVVPVQALFSRFEWFRLLL